MSTDTDELVTRNAAQILVSGRGDATVVRVVAPGKLSSAHLERINKVLIDDVIQGLTGCPCLSGVIDVVFDRGLQRAINVQLG